jgi:hypothetical protein
LSVNGKNDDCVVFAAGNVTKPDDVSQMTTIRNAMTSASPSKVEAMIIDHHNEMTFSQNEMERKYKIFVIADDSNASPIVIYDDLIEHIEIKQVYLFTEIKAKRLHGNVILFTSSNTVINKTNMVNSIRFDIQYATVVMKTSISY